MEISLRKEIELYDWQKDCLSVWEENGRHGIVHVITGAGKTVFALAAADSLRDMPCHIRIVVPTVSLMYQWKKAIMETVSFQWEEPEKTTGSRTASFLALLSEFRSLLHRHETIRLF